MSSRSTRAAVSSGTARPTGVSHRDSPATGTKPSPSVTSLVSGVGCSMVSTRAARPSSTSTAPGRSEPAWDRLSRQPRSRLSRVTRWARWGGATASEHAAAHDQVDREDGLPLGHGEHQRAVQRADDAAELLDGPDHAQRHAPPLRRVEVGHQRQGRRHQAAAAQALQEAAGDHAGQVVGAGGHQRAQGEDEQRPHQDGQASVQVRDAADQRQHRDVPEQEAGHDGRGSLQLVDAARRCPSCPAAPAPRRRCRPRRTPRRRLPGRAAAGGRSDLTGPGCPCWCRTGRSRWCR